jgi:hypothetical protein
MDPNGEVVHVTQQIANIHNEILGLDVGEFIFHDVHHHWHWEGFASYEVWTLNEEGTPGDLYSTAGKVSYCVRDYDPLQTFVKDYTPSPRAPRIPVYDNCGWRYQGLSIGWSDTYHQHLAGQSVEITGLGDGIYALVSTADPGNRIVESDESNNVAVVYFQIEGRVLTIVEDME